VQARAPSNHALLSRSLNGGADVTPARVPASQRRKEAEAAAADSRLSSLLGDVLSGLSSPDGPIAEAEASLAHSTKVRTLGFRMIEWEARRACQ
jgi:hypothetical protein